MSSPEALPPDPADHPHAEDGRWYPDWIGPASGADIRLTPDDLYDEWFARGQDIRAHVLTDRERPAQLTGWTPAEMILGAVVILVLALLALLVPTLHGY
jgi:hypothetical protein